MQIDLNCDMGESFGQYTLGYDAAVMPLISSANIACGFHAGDPLVMHQTVKLAAQHGVGIGAHPGFPDLVGFGRRNMSLSPEELRDSLLYQIGALMGFARVCHTTVRHVKPHGALYNLAANDDALAHTIVDTVLALDANLILFGLAGSKILKIAAQAGLPTAQEVFADRAYQADGTLVPRNRPGAVLTDTAQVTDRVVQMAKDHTIIAITGEKIELAFDTVCVHGDTPGAVEHIKSITQAFKQAGVTIAPVGYKDRL